MKKISVTEIQDDMILAQPVTGSTGNVLMGPGTILKAALGSRLQGWGISTIWVESSESDLTQAPDAAIQLDAVAGVDKIFQGRLVNSAMKTIYSAVKKYKGASYGEP